MDQDRQRGLEGRSRNLSTAGSQLTISNDVPALNVNGEVLYGAFGGANITRKYDAPLASDLYAIALTVAETPIKWASNDPNNSAFTTSTLLTVGGAVVPVGRSLRVYATAAGAVMFLTISSAPVTRFFNPGENEFSFATVQVLAVYATDGASAYAGKVIIENEA